MHPKETQLNQERNRYAQPAGDPIPEHSGCGLPGRRRRIRATTMNVARSATNCAESDRSMSRVADAYGAPAPVRPAAVLRRWSVAELIARAAARPTEGIIGS